VRRQEQAFTPESSDFDPLYAGTAPLSGMGMKADFAPWNATWPSSSRTRSTCRGCRAASTPSWTTGSTTACRTTSGSGTPRALHRSCRPGATLHLFCFAESSQPGLPPPFLRVGEDNLRAKLGRHWRILDICPVTSVTNFTREFLAEQRANNAAIGDPDQFQVNDRGRVLLPMSQLRAERI